MWLKSSDYVPFIIITSSHNAIKPEVLSIEAQQAQICALTSWNISLSSGKVNVTLSAPGQLRRPKVATHLLQSQRGLHPIDKKHLKIYLFLL